MSVALVPLRSHSLSRRNRIALRLPQRQSTTCVAPPNPVALTGFSRRSYSAIPLLAGTGSCTPSITGCARSKRDISRTSRFPEVSRALRALSSAYVERRGRLKEGAALSGAGKRAAFALFYGPLHYLLVREITATIGCSGRLDSPRSSIWDAEPGPAGAAWARRFRGFLPLSVSIVNSWALSEASRTYRAFGLAARTRLGDIARQRWPTSPSGAARRLHVERAAGRGP